jgi:hypothetical protein
MSIKVYSGKVKNVWLPMTVSTAVNRGGLATFTSGELVAATAGTANTNICGIFDKTIASTDDDYADARLVPVTVPLEKHVVYEAAVTSGLVATDIGLEVDATDYETLNRAASTVDVAKCVGVLSTTLGHFWVKINGSY